VEELESVGCKESWVPDRIKSFRKINGG